MNSPEMPPENPYIVEYYYKVKWGHQEEFLSLFRKITGRF